MPVDINRLTEGWLELESDPGLFTLLLEDFGVKGVQVEEIYDLQKPIEVPVYGFIFLFRWIEERRSRRKVVDQTETFVKDEDIVNNIFFAQQMVPNSCATHALLSVLLNCANLHLGDTLSRLKIHTSGMCPENKGWAIGNTPELACAHNSHAMPQAKRRLDKTSGVPTGRFTGEAFHFVSYVPISGRLFELDGLKPYPIDHGPWAEGEDWTEQFRRVMSDRLGIANGDDIRFNLMAVVPDRRLAITHKLKMLKTNKQIVLDALQQLMKIKHPIAGATRAQDRPNITQEQNSDGTNPETGEQATGNSETNEAVQPKMKDKVMLCPLDYSTPLTIQTSPAPSSSSTDTSSEVGSAFNSPTQAWSSWAQASPTSASSKDFKKFVVIRVQDCDKKENQTPTQENSGSIDVNVNGKRSNSGDIHGQKKVCRVKVTSDGDAVTLAEKKYPELFEPHTFAPQDLLALLRNLENEICICELSLKDENDKRNKYKVDDCRRTHNYDEFICTFLSMLAEQGKLADLVQQHLLVQHKRSNVGTTQGGASKGARQPATTQATANSSPGSHKPAKQESGGSTRRRRGRTKCSKRRK